MKRRRRAGPAAELAASCARRRRSTPRRRNRETADRIGRSGDEIEVSLGAFDAPDRFTPTYELWTVRREAWLPPFPLAHHYEHNREGEGRLED